MTDKTYAIVGSDMKAINFILWDGNTPVDVSPNTLVMVPEGSRYDFGWEWNGTEFIDPTPIEST